MPKLVWHIGDVVRKLREARGFKTAKAFAKAMSPPMRENTLGDFEREGDVNRRLDPVTLARLLAALDLEKHQLFALVPVPRQDVVVQDPQPALDPADRELLEKWHGLGPAEQTHVRQSIEFLLQQKKHNDAKTEVEPKKSDAVTGHRK
jgi:hypothetical protein